MAVRNHHPKGGIDASVQSPASVCGHSSDKREPKFIHLKFEQQIPGKIDNFPLSSPPLRKGKTPSTAQTCLWLGLFLLRNRF